jgi:threonine aldolase
MAKPTSFLIRRKLAGHLYRKNGFMAPHYKFIIRHKLRINVEHETMSS